MPLQLGPHQIQAVRDLRNGTILRGGVGSGKSRTALAYFVFKVCDGEVPFNGSHTYRPMGRPRDLFIISTAKKRDTLEWIGESAHFGISPSRDASVGGISLTVDSWNNISRYESVTDAFFIFDEQRLVGSGAWVKSFLKIAKNNQWILLSATPADTWSDYIPVFIANGFYKNRTQFLARHAVYSRFSKYPKISKYVDVDHLEYLRSQVLVDMPYESHTTRHVRNVLVEYDKAKYDYIVKKRWNIYEDRPLKDISEMFIILRRLVNSDPSRLGAVMQLWETHPRLIIFYNHNHELDALRTLRSTLNVTVAEWNGQKHESIPETEKWLYLVQYTAGAESWNCIVTNAIVMYSLNYSYRVIEQAKGRIDRMDTSFTDLWYYMLRSDSPIDKSIAKAIAQKRTFNEKELISKW